MISFINYDMSQARFQDFRGHGGSSTMRALFPKMRALNYKPNSQAFFYSSHTDYYKNLKEWLFSYRDYLLSVTLNNQYTSSFRAAGCQSRRVHTNKDVILWITKCIHIPYALLVLLCSHFSHI